MIPWIFAAGIAFAGGPCDDATKVSERSAVLQTMVDEGKKERQAADPKLKRNDEARAKSAMKMHKSGELCSPQDIFNAAYLLQWSVNSDDLEESQQLAKSAMMSHVQAGAWLTALTYDRWQVSRGLEQRYASQLAKQDGKVCLYPVKADATDQERKSYDMPSIVDAYRRVLDANKLNAQPPTAAAVQANGLFCELKAW